MIYRSLLFVPGARPERFVKALGASADVVCIDLEDGTPPQDKDVARDAVLSFMAAARVAVRINGVESDAFEADAAALSGRAEPAFIMVPKLESADQVALLRDRLGAGHPPIWGVIESAEGLRCAWDIAAAPGLEGILFGGADYSTELGSDMGWDALVFARGALAAACARTGLQLLDVPYLDVQDEEGLDASTRRVKAMGFTGRSCIHPIQVATVNAVFTPTPAQVDHARQVLEVARSTAGGPALLGGKLIDLPIIRAAERILERAERL